MVRGNPLTICFRESHEVRTTEALKLEIKREAKRSDLSRAEERQL
jgi:hypothetical protein